MAQYSNKNYIISSSWKLQGVLNENINSFLVILYTLKARFSFVFRSCNKNGDIGLKRDKKKRVIIPVSFNSFMTGPLSYRNQSIDLRSNQWSSFYMITTFVMKELKITFQYLKNTENIFYVKQLKQNKLKLKV